MINLDDKFKTIKDLLNVTDPKIIRYAYENFSLPIFEIGKPDPYKGSREVSILIRALREILSHHHFSDINIKGSIKAMINEKRTTTSVYSANEGRDE